MADKQAVMSTPTQPTVPRQYRPEHVDISGSEFTPRIHSHQKYLRKALCRFLTMLSEIFLLWTRLRGTGVGGGGRLLKNVGLQDSNQ